MREWLLAWVNRPLRAPESLLRPVAGDFSAPWIVGCGHMNLLIELRRCHEDLGAKVASLESPSDEREAVVNLYIVVSGFVIATIIGAIGVRILLRHLLSPVQAEQAERTVPFLLGSIGGFFGLVGGLLLSSSWNDLRALRQSMTEEVGSLAVLDRAVSTLPRSLADTLHRDILAYLESVVRVELPKLSTGQTDPATAEHLGEIWLTLAHYDAKTPADVSLRSLAMEKLIDVAKFRQERIVFRREKLPLLLWVVLIASGAAVIVGACFGSLRYDWPVPPFLSSLAGLIALILFSIHALHAPFQYHLTTPSSEYLRLWDIFRGPETAIEPAQHAADSASR